MDKNRKVQLNNDSVRAKFDFWLSRYLSVIIRYRINTESRVIPIIRRVPSINLRRYSAANLTGINHEIFPLFRHTVMIRLLVIYLFNQLNR